jgi:hypothetical protein
MQTPIIIHLRRRPPEVWLAAPEIPGVAGAARAEAQFQPARNHRVPRALPRRPFRGGAIAKRLNGERYGKGDRLSHAYLFPLSPQLYLGLLPFLSYA